MLRTALFRGVLFLGWSFLTVEVRGGGGPQSHNYRTRAQFQQEHVCVCVCIAEKICGWVPISGEGTKSLRATLAQPRARVAPSLSLLCSLLCLYTQLGDRVCACVCV
jgi:hypothetical protein